MLTRAPDGTLRLPALATAHSHAFQRALRGQGQRPIEPGADDFWTWRGAMYALAASLTPDSMHAIALVAFRELARAGIRTVGEFHYVHHQADGTPYDDRTVMADAVVLAAREAGLRIALLRGPARSASASPRRAAGRSSSSPTTASSRPGSSPFTRPTWSPTRPASSARCAPSPASVRPPNATSATASPTWASS
jgi:formimidoylglutamate deiminase